MNASHSREPRRSRSHGGIPPVTGAQPELAQLDRVAIEPERRSNWVRVTCPACGVVRVRPESVVLRHCVDDLSWSYRARCPDCGKVFLGVTPASLALPAIAAGLIVETWSLPVPSARRAGSPIQAIDALELHLALLEPDWLDQLTKVDPPGDR